MSAADCRASSRGRSAEARSSLDYRGSRRHDRKSRAAIASRRGPSGAGAQRPRHSATETPRRPRHRKPGRRGRMSPRKDRDSEACSPARGRRAPLQTHPRRRCPCRYRSLRRIDPGTRRKRPRRRDRCRPCWRRCAGTATPRGRSVERV